MCVCVDSSHPRCRVKSPGQRTWEQFLCSNPSQHVCTDQKSGQLRGVPQHGVLLLTYLLVASPESRASSVYFCGPGRKGWEGSALQAAVKTSSAKICRLKVVRQTQNVFNLFPSYAPVAAGSHHVDAVLVQVLQKMHR